VKDGKEVDLTQCPAPPPGFPGKNICDVDLSMLLCWVSVSVTGGSTRLPFKLGEPGSIFGWTSTQGLKIIGEKELPLQSHYG
jgi:hypothetical protein